MYCYIDVMIKPNSNGQAKNDKPPRINEAVFAGVNGIGFKKLPEPNVIWKTIGSEQGPLTRSILKILEQARQNNLSSETVAMQVSYLTLHAAHQQRRRSEGIQELKNMFLDVR